MLGKADDPPDLTGIAIARCSLIPVALSTVAFFVLLIRGMIRANSILKIAEQKRKRSLSQLLAKMTRPNRQRSQFIDDQPKEDSKDVANGKKAVAVVLYKCSPTVRFGFSSISDIAAKQHRNFSDRSLEIFTRTIVRVHRNSCQHETHAGARITKSSSGNRRPDIAQHATRL